MPVGKSLATWDYLVFYMSTDFVSTAIPFNFWSVHARLWVGNQMANSSDCFPKAEAFLETVPSPFTHPVAIRWTSIAGSTLQTGD